MGFSLGKNSPIYVMQHPRRGFDQEDALWLGQKNPFLN